MRTYDLYSSANNFRMINTKVISRIGNIACIEEMFSAYSFLK